MGQPPMSRKLEIPGMLWKGGKSGCEGRQSATAGCGVALGGTALADLAEGISTATRERATPRDTTAWWPGRTRSRRVEEVTHSRSRPWGSRPMFVKPLASVMYRNIWGHASPTLCILFHYYTCCFRTQATITGPHLQTRQQPMECRSL